MRWKSIGGFCRFRATAKTGKSEQIGLSQRERRSLAGKFDGSGVQLEKSCPDHYGKSIDLRGGGR